MAKLMQNGHMALCWIEANLTYCGPASRTVKRLRFLANYRYRQLLLRLAGGISALLSEPARTLQITELSHI